LESTRGGARSALDIAARLVGIAPEGALVSFAMVLLSVAALAVGFRWVALPLLLLAFAIAAFFRDPERSPPLREGVLVSAADGKVVEIGERRSPALGEAPVMQVSVFMSPLNVQVNRAPQAGEVVEVQHTPGEFRAAFSDYASQYNERNLIVFEGSDGRRFGVIQIAGYLARRIVCRLKNRDRVQQGQRIGLIMFGSRVDHLLPSGYRVTVKIGERVRAGETPIGELAK